MNLINGKNLYKGGRRSIFNSVKCKTFLRHYPVIKLGNRSKFQPLSLSTLARSILTLACLFLFLASTLFVNTKVLAATSQANPISSLFLPRIVNAANQSDVNTSGIPWPQINHKNGALFITNSTDANLAHTQGLSFSLFESHFMTADLRQAYQQLGMTYVDDDPWQQIQAACGTIGGTGTCSLTDQQKQTILANVKNHLTLTASDPLIAGYMIIDDYPGGDVRDILQGIHDLIVEANKTAVFPRFSECDFGSLLDSRTSTTSPWQTRHASFDKAITNYSPTACDVVMFYFEGYNSPAYYNQPELIDWSMSNLLPYAMNSLKALGWNPATQPLIGSPQLYDWTQAWWQTNIGSNTIWMVKPSATSVSTQIQAFCQAGAVAITGYAWNDPSHDASVKYELSNDAAILNGYNAGIQQCKSLYWNDTQLASPTQTVPPTPTPTLAPTLMPTPTVASTLVPTSTQAPTITPTATQAPTLLPTPTIQPTSNKHPTHKKP